VNELKKEIKDIDLSIICTKLCSMDPLFPPDEMWVDYYMNDGIKRLDDIINTSIISKFKGLTL